MSFIANSLDMCDADNLPRFSIGLPPPITLAHLKINNGLQQAGVNGPQIGQFKRDAVAAYCPGETSG
jgi:hypothetical protein